LFAEHLHDFIDTRRNGPA